MKSHRRDLHALLLLNHLPWLVAVGVLLIATWWSNRYLNTQDHLLSVLVARGQLEPGRIHEVISRVQSELFIGVVLAVLTVAVALTVWYRSEAQIAERMRAIGDHLDRLGRGEAVEPLASGRDSISFTEDRINELGRVLAERDAALREAAARHEFEVRLRHALDRAANEAEVIDIASRAFEEAVPDLSVELRLSDASEAHLRLAAQTKAPDLQCEVEGPQFCPAVRGGQSVVTTDTEALDACPHLSGETRCAVACVPVTAAGREIGVIRAERPVDSPFDSARLVRLEVVANQVGVRLGMIRALATTELQAATDPLTGLLNRRSFEARLSVIENSDHPYALAMLDIDHFKRLNDVHGHETGDRALRALARALTNAVRPGDVVARIGGEEFALVLPRCSSSVASQVLDRVRSHLEAEIARSDLPSFTLSAGIAEGRGTDSGTQAMRRADDALYESKRAGRNLVTLDQRCELVSS